ncbi:dioxygenase family protein [Imtechella halotolerans]|uniref:Intradiol ring-cleavage dioxygenase n=1 Tax=Imtechella halotolerans K1 TaxID=946077 RepID=I0WFY7_9FLAO|nr:intradiol ring-cleavage dioxygenase [Imtechella halotolerans]EID75303.1 intradiol ring-cleavage dioxygenase [Imtechella halotolerans K1]WMQ63938.1 intradiol ring-cleavage dioxygenase [Imtechella halotolerans]
MNTGTTSFHGMIRIVRLTIAIIFFGFFASCNGQIKTNSQPTTQKSPPKLIVGGGCDGCELMYIGMPQNLKSIDTNSAWNDKGQKLLVTGTVYKFGGKVPAPNVILYYWQTDSNGYYTPEEGMDQEVRKHGRIRGWVKTDANGKYSIYTIRPAAYPNRDTPAHIHISVKEPEIDNEYYIDNLVFTDDPLLTGKERRKLENRGGSGILRILLDKEMQVAEHSIVLGLNIPNYPEKNQERIRSGLEIGEDNPSFTPYHAYGPDKGTTVCPVCKYGRFHGILYFVGNHPNYEDIKKWLSFLEQESVHRKNYIKVYFVYGNDKDYDKDKRGRELEALGKELNIKNTALTFVPSFSDEESEANLNKINPEVENTFVIYKHRVIIDKYVNLKPTQENFNLISQTLDKTRSEYFHLSEPKYH